MQEICDVEDKLEKNPQNAEGTIRESGQRRGHVSKIQPQIVSPKYAYCASNCVKTKLHMQTHYLGFIHVNIYLYIL